MIRIIVELLALYLLYKLIFDFIIPVYRTTKQVNRKMSEMQTKMKEQMEKQQGKGFPEPPKEKASRSANEDYIEFEEVK